MRFENVTNTRHFDLLRCMLEKSGLGRDISICRAPSTRRRTDPATNRPGDQ